MPILFGLSILIAIYFCVHAFRTRQNYYWIGLMLGMPFLGSLIYFLVIYLPDVRQTRLGYELESKLRHAIDPMKNLREAEKAYKIAPTVGNKLRLAQALVESGRATEAVPYYQEILATPSYQQDSTILSAYATAQFESGHYAETKQILSSLSQSRQDPQIQLLYAKTLALLNERLEATQVFEQIMANNPSLESELFYATSLAHWGEKAQAKSRLQQLEQHFSLLPKHAQQLHKQTIKQARELAKALS